MNRRHFLQAGLLGSVALGLAGRGFAAGLPAAAADPFAAGLRRHPWLAGWQDASLGEGTAAAARTLQVEGRVPAGLQGTLFRNGPGRFTRAGLRYKHWFDGDGLMQAWDIGATGISHRARFVGTAKFRREQVAGKFLLPAIGTRVPDAVGIRNSDDLNTANTAVMVHDEKLYALWEGGSAYELDRDTLDAKGPKAWREDARAMPFSAHPLHESDGSAWNFGLMGSKLVVWRLRRDGSLHTMKTITLDAPGYLHAFSMTDQYLVFVVLPYVLEGDLADTAYMDSLRWRPERGCRALVLDKADLDQQRWFELPAGAAYHYGPAVQRGSEIQLAACWNRDGVEAVSPFRSEMVGVPRRINLGSSVERIRLDLSSGRGRIETLLDGAVDFPDWNSADASGAFYALGGADETESGYFDQVLRLDDEGKLSDRYRYGAHHLVEEHRFVAAPGARRASQGWLLGTVLDYKAMRTGLCILDAENLAAGPLAQAWLPHTLPLGFHGAFI